MLKYFTEVVPKIDSILITKPGLGQVGNKVIDFLIETMIIHRWWELIVGLKSAED